MGSHGLHLAPRTPGLSHMLRKYLGCHPGRSAARSGALQTRDPSTPASEKGAAGVLGSRLSLRSAGMTTEEVAPYGIALPRAGRGRASGIACAARELNEAAARSSQLQRGQAGEREHDRDDPEADHDLRLGPAELLEVVVDRSHLEDVLAREFERDQLQDQRPGFELEK